MADTGNSGIYEIVNLVNGKRYVGSAVDLERRWWVHRSELERGRHHCRHLQAAWKKYGAVSFEFRILILCERSALIAEEQAEFDLCKPEYNVLPKAGSRLGMKHSEAARAKIAASSAGNKYALGYRHSPEARAGFSAARIGKLRNPEAAAKTAAAHRGMKRSDETRAKISAAAKGRKKPPRSDETRAKLSAALKGKPKSPVSIAKMRATKVGSHLSEEHRAAIGLALKAAWAKRKAVQLR